jgi:large subunit ribosomal protein L18
MKGTNTARAARVRRHVRVRNTLSGTAARPRLAVFRSLNHIYAQVIDDTAGHTLAAASDLDKDVRSGIKSGQNKCEVATAVGEALARHLKDQKIRAIVFDRGGFKYHGRVKALAEAVRKGGIEF